MTENKLMDKPEGQDIEFASVKFFYGKDMEDYVTNSIYDDWCRFHFPAGVKEKIEPHKMYKVWFHYRDASDPMDSSCSYTINYIEEVPENIKEAYVLWKKNEKIVKDYLLIK